MTTFGSTGNLVSIYGLMRVTLIISALMLVVSKRRFNHRSN
jgi:hypothetical protein